MNNIEELKAKKPENLKSLSSIAAGYVADNNTGGYFVVECGNCGEVFPSQKLDGDGAIADSGDYGDAYCPHCNETDPDECANVGLVWNVQQAKINALIAQLEAAHKRIAELDNSESQLINERDHAESTINSMFVAVMSEKPEWSNMYQFIDAVDEVEDFVSILKQRAESAEAALSAANEKLKVPIKLPKKIYLKSSRGNVISWSKTFDAIEAAGFTVEGE